MKNNDFSENEIDLSAIEVRFTPEYQKQYLEAGLRQTRQRAGELLADLLTIARGPEPDLEKIRQLAEGIEVESKRARKLTLALCRS